MRRAWIPVLVGAAVAVPGCGHRSTPVYPSSPSNAIVRGARDQLSWGTTYNASYRRIAYPGGDVPRTAGACTDVVIRAFRWAGYDFQKLVHEDLAVPGSGYPQYANSRGPDTNIDHRRCPNLRRYLERHGLELTTSVDAGSLAAWRPGDIVFWKVGDKDHVGVVSDVKTQQGMPYVFHNIGEPVEEDCLERWRIVGHFRFPKEGIESIKPTPRTRR